MANYTAYVLDQQSRDKLIIAGFVPKYIEFIAHHITVVYDVPKDTPIPPEATLKVIGYADSGDGIETLVVSVNGTYERADGRLYHITWSLDPTKYSPKDSNPLLSKTKFKLVRSIVITGIPSLL